MFSRANIITALSLSLCLMTPPTRADKGGLDGFVGRWQVLVHTLQPTRSESSYTETYEWVLEGEFLRGKTGRKSDGTYDIVFATYDEKVDGYPFWIFSSSGSYTYLFPASWDAQKKTMEWKNPPEFDISYQSRCAFPDRNSRQCFLIVKDWRGAVVSELEWSAKRLSE